ncbi:leucine-rich repeat protein [Ruminococcus bromii]|jgi:hypothetical protein|uniref:leucine-rich repeat protein n=1 Tax=Ruminococcus bromii TaxID=40518 RepID=UPI003AB64E6B
MRKSNKVISAMLSVLMVSGMFTAMPLAVNAAGTADTNETTTSAAVQSADDTQSDSEEKEYNGFTYYTHFNEENNRTEAVITGYKGIDNDLVIPDSIDNAVVTSIGEKAFAESNQFESITIPDSIGSIGEGAFDCREDLSKVYINSLENWCKIDFKDSGSQPMCNFADLYINGNLLTDLTVPDSITSINNYTFSGCTSITSVTLPNCITKICDDAFSFCDNLEKVEFGHELKSIGNYAFAYTSLKNITIPDSVTYIGDYAFSCCSFESIVIPDSLTSVNDYAFSYCNKLKTVIIPDSVTKIGYSAFDECLLISNVLFKGSKSQWNSIDFSDSNYYLVESVIHYDVKFVEKKAPTCVNKGYDLYSCSECSDGVKINYTDPLGHNVVSGICERCGKSEEDFVESAHPYNDDADESWTIYKKDADRIVITFSNTTETMANRDYIYLYDKNGEEIGNYSGTELAGKKITVLGDTVKIRLVSYVDSTLFGFSLSNIVPYYDECLHSSTRLENEKSPTCVEEGYTGDLFCNNCEAFLKKGDIIPATGNHEYIDGVCKICGAISLENLPSISGNETQNVIIENTDVRKYFKFTPSQSGSLTFYSTGSSDTLGRLLDSNMVELAYNDDNGEDRNFRIRYNVKARETYVLQIGAYTSSDEAFNVTFNFEPNKETLLGDVNGDGEITIVDSTILQKYIVGQTTLDDETLNVADVNKDGAITVVDATLIQKFVVKVITEF